MSHVGTDAESETRAACLDARGCVRRWDAVARGSDQELSVTHVNCQGRTTEMERRVGYLRRNQPLTGRGPFHRTPWIRPTSTLVVNVEPCTFGLARVDVQPTSSAGIRLQIHSVPVARLYRYVTYCERLSRYEIPRRSVSLASG